MLRKDRSPVKKRAKIPKKVKTPEKLSYEKTNEELEESMRADVKAQFAPKKPPTDPIKELLNTYHRRIVIAPLTTYITLQRAPLQTMSTVLRRHIAHRWRRRNAGKKFPS